MLGLIVSLIIVGLLAGAIARLLVPGKQDISIPMTIVLGIIGSFVGGFLGYLIFQQGRTGRFLPALGNYRLHHRRGDRVAAVDQVRQQVPATGLTPGAAPAQS